MPIAIQQFYLGLPLNGIPLNRQWHLFRDDFNALAPIVHAAEVDISNTSGNHDLSFLDIGELDFRNRFRVGYDKDNDRFTVQYNIGTEDVPVWVDYLVIRQSDGRVIVLGIGGIESQNGFYGFGTSSGSSSGSSSVSNFYGVSFRESELGGFRQTSDTLIVDSTFFYLSSSGNNKPLLSFNPSAISAGSGEVNTASNLGTGQGVFAQKVGVDLQFKSITGTGATVSSTPTEINIAVEPSLGFYGITVGQTNNNPSFKNINTIKFETQFFYLSQNDTDTAIVSLRPPASNGGSGEVNTASNLGSGTGIFAQKSGVDLQFKSLVAGENVSISANSTEITFSSIKDPGFYGIVIKESEAGGRVERDDTIVFDSNSGFYLGQAGDDRKPLVSFHDHIESFSSTFVGDQSLIASDIATGAGHAIIAKRLTAGSNVTFTVDANQIAINSSTIASSSDPGFYGVLFKESKAGGRVERDDTIVFDSNSGFYLTTAGNSNKPLLSFNDYVGSLSSTLVGDQSLISSDTAIGSNHSLVTKRLTAGSNVTISADSNQITINSTAISGSSNPGFYGVTFKESEAGGRVERDDTLIFDSTFFYLDQSGGKPFLSSVGFPIVAESEFLGFAKSSNKIKFDSTFFYISSGGDGNPLISLNSVPSVTGGTVLLASYNPINVTSIDITSVISPLYSSYQIDFTLAPLTDDVEFWVRTSVDNGASFEAGLSTYDYINNGILGTSYSLNCLGNATKMVVSASTVGAANVGNDVGEHIKGHIDFHVGSAALFPVFNWTASYIAGSGTFAETVGGGRRNSAAAVNAIRLLFESGNMTGTVRVLGIPA